jgi:hypothetical protein
MSSITLEIKLKSFFTIIKDNGVRCIIFGDVTKPAKKLFIHFGTGSVVLPIKLCSYMLPMLANIARLKRPPCGRPNFSSC